MDPLTALSVAGTIVQFADFGCKLFSGCRELYKSTSGALAANEEIELVTVDLEAVVVKLRRSVCPTDPSSSLIKDDQWHRKTFEKICDDAVTAAEEIIERLHKLKVKCVKGRKWESFWQAVKSAWSQEEIAALMKRLANLKEALETRVLFSISATMDAQSIQMSSYFKRLEQQTQNIISSLLDNQIQAKDTNTVTHEIRGELATLIQMVRRLDTVSPNERLRTRAAIIGSHRSDQGDEMKEIISMIEMLDVPDEEEIKLRKSVTKAILQSLSYPSMSHRYESVLESYPETFEWAFRDSETKQRPWSNLSQWLRSGEGIYWINGKAGSGKSTLIKHIFDDARTYKFLRGWANGAALNPSTTIPLCLASLFFWNSGTQEQKSQTGLFRGLLFQILRSTPELIPIVLAERWARTYSCLMNITMINFDESWNLRELISVFRKVIQQIRIPLKLCLLIDGLDEFDGDYDEIIQLFTEIVKSHNVKICVSSRLWQVFKDNFRTYPTLRLQDLTYSDIEYYVNNKFRKSLAFQRLLSGIVESVDLLVHEIVEKADGVFLWVRIVVKSLIEGVRNRDDIAILRERVRLLPRELEPLYEHLLKLIEPFYIVWASKAFQIIRASIDVWGETSGSSLNSRDSGTALSILKFLLAIKEELSLDTIQGLHQDSIGRRYEDTAVQLTARCAGLLEVSNLDYLEQVSPDSTIQYLHRTVREFLERDECWSRLLTHTAGTTFNPHVALLKACTMWTQIQGTPYFERNSAFSDMSYCALLHAHRANRQTETHKLQTSILDHLDRFMILYSGPYWSSVLLHSKEVTFLDTAAVYSLTGYVSKKLSNLERSSVVATASSLLHRLMLHQSQSTKVPVVSIDMVLLLLRCGADPKSLSLSSKSLCESILHHAVSLDQDSEEEAIHIMKLLVSLDAGKDVYIVYKDQPYSSADIMREFLEPLFPDATAKLLHELGLKKRNLLETQEERPTRESKRRRIQQRE